MNLNFHRCNINLRLRPSKVRVILAKLEETKTKKGITDTTNQNTKLAFRLFFIGTKDLDVEVMEVEKIDFENVKTHLELGESIFIATIQPPSIKPNFIETDESWYFPRI
jgi:hypothetical protein